MKIKIQDIPTEGLHLSRDLDPSRWDLSEKGLSLLEPIRTVLDLINHGHGGVYIEGAISSTMLAECSRCLDRFPYSLHSEFHFEYVPMTTVPTGGEHALSRDALDLHFYEGDQIELDNELISQLFLLVPMHPLCQNDCRGLCPQCGETLNRGPCHCQPESPDPSWTGLKHFTYKEPNANSNT